MYLEEFVEPVFTSYTLSVWGPALVIEWDDFIVSLDDPFLDCGFPKFELTNQDGTPLDEEIFTRYIAADIFEFHSLTI